MARRIFRSLGCCSTVGVGLLVGCTGSRVAIPTGHLPVPYTGLDAQSTNPLLTSSNKLAVLPKPADGGMKTTFELPAALPGAEAPNLQVPRFEKGATANEREEMVHKTYPTLNPVAAALPAMAEGQPLSLADLQQLALAHNPSIQKAAHQVDSAYGQVIQAGLHPNPTVGYQVDQWQPNLQIPPGAKGSGNGQQGGFINLLIKTANKLSLAQRVAGYDYINALVAVRKAQIDVTASVRGHYFAVLIAQQSLEVNKALTEMADEVYRLQLRQVAAGEAAGYEPLQLYAQAVQARNAVTQAEAGYKAAWKQLASSIGQPNMPPVSLSGRADAIAPVYQQEGMLARILEQHTDLLTARNTIAQAQSNLALQQKLPIPDLQTNTYHQYDNLARTYQFGVQVGINLPISDRNQGNIRTAEAQIAASCEQLRTTQNDLTGKLAEAFGRYEAQTRIANNYRDEVLPRLSQAYRALIRRYQVEPEKVAFSDIVVAQQNFAVSLQSYLTALQGQWQAVVDTANVSQLDDLYPPVSE